MNDFSINDVTDGEELARHIDRLYRLIADLQNKVGGIVMHGAITDVDAKKQLCRVEVGTEKMPQKSGWVPYGLGFAGEFSQIWHPSKGQNVTLVSPVGDKAQSVVWPYTYSKKYPAPSDDAACHILCNFGTSRIEVWKDRIKIISDNVETIGHKTISETTCLYSETANKDKDKNGGNITETAEHDITDTATHIINLHTLDDPSGSAIMLKTGNPEHGDSFIGLQTGDPELGDSKILINTGEPTVGDAQIAVIVASPKLPTGKSELDMIAGTEILEQSGGNINVIGVGEIKIQTALRILEEAGFEIKMEAGLIEAVGTTYVGGLGGPPIARLGDKVAVDTLTGLGAIITGAGNSFAM